MPFISIAIAIHFNRLRSYTRETKLDTFNKTEADYRLMVEEPTVTKVKYTGEVNVMKFLEVALDGICREKSSVTLRNSVVTIDHSPISPMNEPVHQQKGNDRVSVKRPSSKNSDCLLRTVAELANLPDVALNSVVSLSSSLNDHDPITIAPAS